MFIIIMKKIINVIFNNKQYKNYMKNIFYYNILKVNYFCKFYNLIVLELNKVFFIFFYFISYLYNKYI